MTTCIKEKNFSPIPAIVFERYVSYVSNNNLGTPNDDSAYCYIKFKDGDGDIGFLAGDTTTLTDLTMKYWYKSTDGTFLPRDSKPATLAMDTLFYTYRVPNITPDGQYKALDGEITIKLRTQPLYYPSDKVVKFDIILTDRAGHKSNMVETNEINVNP
jgi:hypothetical protein